MQIFIKIFFLNLILINLFIFIGARKLKECADYGTCDKCVNSTDFLGGQCYWCVSGNICVHSLLNLCPYKHVINFNYNCPKTFYGDFGYSDDFVRNKVVPLLCAANEESKEDIQLALHRKFKRIQVVKLYHVKCEENSEEICIAYLVILHEKQTIAVVFRGYKNIEVFLNKMSNPLELREWVDFNITGSKVDADFMENFERFWKHGLKKDIEYVIKGLPTYEFWVIGYSQGGAIASIASTIFVRNGYVDSHDLKQFTLGQPRVGDLGFAQGHDQFVPFSFRIVNKHDPIPTLPRRDFILDSKLGPYHHRYEVWYKNSMSQASNHMVSHMAEDPLGRASEELVTDPHDHLNYFDVDISSCQV